MAPNMLDQYKSMEVELEGVRLEFLRLLQEISDSDWDRRLPGEGWSARQEMAHVTQVIQLLPMGIRRAATGRRYSLLSVVPEPLRRWANGYLIVPMRYRSATRASLASDYEEAHAALLKVLRDLPEGAWSRGAYFPRQYRTVEQMAHRPAEHFAEHAAHLRQVLGLEPGRR